MTITERLMQLDSTLILHNEGEWSGRILNYSAFNDGGIECEVGEFLYGFIRVLKPLQVLETGTHYGIGASYMALALRDNLQGWVDTVEFQSDNATIANGRFDRMGFKNIYSYLNDAKDFQPPYKYQLILLDTEPATRFQELIKFYGYLDEGGYIFIHDLNGHMSQQDNEEHGFGWPFGEIPTEMKQLVQDDSLRPFHFRSPRGLTGFYKPSESDYKWI